MKYLLSILIFCSCIFYINAEKFRVNYKESIKPFNFRIEKVEVKNGETYVYCKVQEFKNFSYNLSFEDCYLIIENVSDIIPGKLTAWSDDKKVTQYVKSVSDENDEKFVLTFPGTDISNVKTFGIKIGNIMDKKKTDIIFKDIKIRK